MPKGAVVEIVEQEVLFEPIQKISKDLIKAARNLPLNHIRYLVDYYYQLQDMRKRSDLQVKHAGTPETGLEGDEPVDAIQWMVAQTSAMENTIKRALNAWTEGRELGIWCKSITGIGPVITAGLMAHIDLREARTVGKIWQFAGLNPTVKWNKGQKRPWNAKLKVLCWKIGESFVKVQNNKNDFYGKLFVQREQWEWERNLDGGNQQAADQITTDKNFGRDTQAIKWYKGHFDPAVVRQYLAQGKPLIDLQPNPTANPEWRMLPPAQIHSRAKRWVVKMFLSHYYEVGRQLELGEEPINQYVFAILGHTDKIEPPNWDGKNKKIVV